jgi:hypothetical protein
MDLSDERGVRPGNVYVMRRLDGIRKVGTAVNLKRRMTELKGTNGPIEIEIFWTMSERATWFVESQMHTILRPYRHDGNEYYDAPLRQIIAAFRNAKNWARQYVVDGDLGTVQAYKRIGFKNKAGYLRRLAVAKANLAKRGTEVVKPET